MRSSGFPLASLLLFLLPHTRPVAAHEQQQPLLFDGTGSQSDAHRIAIVGAGAGGASTAYHLRKFADESLSRPLNITIFETNSRIGGRTTTVNAFGDERHPIELGASIFVKVNHILYNATKEFELDLKAKVFEASSASDYDLGVWDGRQFVFKQGSGNGRWQGWWDIAKLLWKYRMSPIRTQQLMKKVIGRFLQFYEQPIFPFKSLLEAVRGTDLVDTVAGLGKDILSEAAISEQFANDIVQSSTRVNYAQNLDQIHGLETLVCMAADGAMQVDGGNWQIFHEAVKRSRAHVFLDTSVTDVKSIPASEEDTTKHYQVSVDNAAVPPPDLRPFENIVLASPFQFANLSFSPPLSIEPEPIPYVKLHVTLFASPHLLSPQFFDLGEDAQRQVPSTVLTTLPYTKMATPSDPHKFFSVSTLKQVTVDDELHYIYKIFSPAPMTGSFLASLFNFPHTNSTPSDPVSEIPAPHITWSHEKVWNSYPYETPRTTFEAIRLDGEDGSGSGVWYTSGIESFISTMETSALMGMNVAKLIIQELEHKEMQYADQWSATAAEVST